MSSALAHLRERKGKRACALEDGNMLVLSSEHVSCAQESGKGQSEARCKAQLAFMQSTTNQYVNDDWRERGCTPWHVVDVPQLHQKTKTRETTAAAEEVLEHCQGLAGEGFAFTLLPQGFNEGTGTLVQGVLILSDVSEHEAFEEQKSLHRVSISKQGHI